MRPLTVLALLLALAVAACGDDDGGASPTASPTHTPSASPTPSLSPEAPAEQLSYIGPDGEIRLVNADGTGDDVLTDTSCASGERAQEFSMAWSPDGSALGFICVSETVTSLTLVVLDSDGDELARVPDVTRFRWSPDSSRLAYQTLVEPFDVGIFDAGTGTTETINDNAVLMEWVGPDSLLLGLEPVIGDLTIEFKAHLVGLASGASTPYPEFDNARMLWVSPDGAKAVTLTEQRPPEGSGLGMAVYDFAQDLPAVIDRAYIGYPSEFIPHEQLAFSHDGAAIYWANAAEGPASVWTSRLDFPQARKLGEVQSIFVAVSPSGRVAGTLPEEGGPGRILIEDFASGASIDVGPGGLPFAWRTVPTP